MQNTIYLGNIMVGVYLAVLIAWIMLINYLVMRYIFQCKPRKTNKSKKSYTLNDVIATMLRFSVTEIIERDIKNNGIRSKVEINNADLGLTDDQVNILFKCNLDDLSYISMKVNELNFSPRIISISIIRCLAKEDSLRQLIMQAMISSDERIYLAYYIFNFK